MTFYVAYNASKSEVVIKNKDMLVEWRDQSKSTMFRLYYFRNNKYVLVHLRIHTHTYSHTHTYIHRHTYTHALMHARKHTSALRVHGIC